MRNDQLLKVFEKCYSDDHTCDLRSQSISGRDVSALFACHDVRIECIEHLSLVPTCACHYST